jgi:ribosome biogenesis protein Nip4
MYKLQIPETNLDTEDKLVMLTISAVCQRALQCPTKETMKNLHKTFTSVPLNGLKENQTRILLTLLQLISKETIGCVYLYAINSSKMLALYKYNIR